MELKRLEGKYVIAVSGGVDSSVLLDLLAKQQEANPKLELIIAHYDHGIRSDSPLDRKFVEELSKKYKLQFFFSEGNLGKATSEQKAREARYGYLQKVVKHENAAGLITAHHEDDLIETAIINIIRGTGRKGLTAIYSNNILRPLLEYSKEDIKKYAIDNKLTWREDSTNNEDKYLRNYIRHNIIPKLDKDSRIKLLDILNKQKVLNQAIDKKLNELITSNIKENKLPRLWLNSLDNRLSKEVIAAWLRANKLSDFDKSTITKLSSDLKIMKPNKRIDVYNNWYIISTKEDLALEHVER